MEAADDSAKAPATKHVPPLDALGAAPDLEEPSTKPPPTHDDEGEGEEGHPHNHIHEGNNSTCNGHWAQPDETTGSEAPPSDAPHADGPGRAQNASNKRPPSKGDDAARQRRSTRKQSAFAISEAITSDPASVVDHEARHMRPAELFNEALKSYFDVSIAAALVSWLGIIGVLGISRVVGATGGQRPPPTNPTLRTSLRPYTRVVLVFCDRLFFSFSSQLTRTYARMRTRS
jgi:hypothetical protein